MSWATFLKAHWPRLAAIDFHGSFKREVANRMIFFGERHLQHSIDEFLEYYHEERNHQGLGGQIINPPKSIGSSAGKLRRRERLGGMLNYYYRDAA
jgi:putative transposase